MTRAKDLNVLGSWAFTANDLPLRVDMIYKARDRYPWRKMQTLFPFTVAGVKDAVAQAVDDRALRGAAVAAQFLDPAARTPGLGAGLLWEH